VDENLVFLHQSHFATGPLLDCVGSHREILHFRGQCVVTRFERFVGLFLGLHPRFKLADALPPAFTPP